MAQHGMAGPGLMARPNMRNWVCGVDERGPPSNIAAAMNDRRATLAHNSSEFNDRTTASRLRGTLCAGCAPRCSQ
eukprot:365102-Chlamydomonas_euryale.AAC.4